MKKLFKKYLVAASLIFAAINVCNAQTEIKIAIDSLPASTKKNLNEKFQDYTVSKIVMLTDKAGVVNYKVETKKSKSANENIVYDLVYDSSGNLLSKKKSKEIFYTDSPKFNTEQHNQNDGHQH